MVILERDVQHIYPDKWDELNAIDGEFNQIESGLGFPAKKTLPAAHWGRRGQHIDR